MHHTVTLAKAPGEGQLTKGHAPVPQACLLPEPRCAAAVAVASSPSCVQEGPVYSCLRHTEQKECACRVASGREPSDQDKVVKRQTEAGCLCKPGYLRPLLSAGFHLLQIAGFLSWLPDTNSI